MPATLKQGSPRSVLRHRPIEADDKTPYDPFVARASRKPQYAVNRSVTAKKPAQCTEPEDQVLKRIPSTTISSSRSRIRPLTILGLGILLTVSLGIVFMQGWAWGQNAWVTLIYGDPRVSQVDAVVGHSDDPGNPSHFLTINLRGQIEVIEWPGGDAARMRTYLGPRLFGPGADQPLATVRFADLLGNGKLDMIIQVQGSLSVLINDAGVFRPVRPNEEQTILEHLRKLDENAVSN